MGVVFCVVGCAVYHVCCVVWLGVCCVFSCRLAAEEQQVSSIGKQKHSNMAGQHSRCNVTPTGKNDGVLGNRIMHFMCHG